ncbi:MAG: hypothetical protein HXS47_11410 [Theionarchaea archaeon]|nr:hypothetical protein [Theionarchaea archaeon]
MEQLRHTPDELPEWNESYYFNFYDPHEDIGGFTRIGYKPNITEGTGYLFLFYRGDILVFHHHKAITAVPDLISMGGLEFIPEWKIRFSGSMQKMKSTSHTPVDVTVDLTYAPLSAEFSYVDCVTSEELQRGRVVCEDHYEQIGIMKGNITIDSQVYQVTGFSERDHSWGERDWNAPRKWIYVTAHFDRDFAINIATMDLGTTHIDVGFIFHHGENIPVDSICETTISDKGQQTSFHYDIEDVQGNSYIIEGEVLNTVHIPYERQGRLSILHENLARFTCEGKEGYGIAEYLIRKN